MLSGVIQDISFYQILLPPRGMMNLNWIFLTLKGDGFPFLL